MSVASTWEKARTVYRDDGPASLLRRGAAKAARWGFEYNHARWLVRELDPPGAEGDACVANLSVGDPQGVRSPTRAAAARVPGFAESFERVPESPVQVTVHADLAPAVEWISTLGKPGWMLDPRELQVAREERHVWCTARSRGETAGYLKVGRGRVFIPDFDRIVAFPPGWAFVCDTFVLETHRGEGIGRALVREACRHLTAGGFRRFACHIPDWNDASFRLFTSCGFRFKKRIRFLRLFGRGVLSHDPARL